MLRRATVYTVIFAHDAQPRSGGPSRIAVADGRGVPGLRRGRHPPGAGRRRRRWAVTLVVSGDAEVASPWTPAAMRCDSYCYTRARTFFDSVAVFGDDGQVHGMLAESIEPNDDYTRVDDHDP